VEHIVIATKVSYRVTSNQSLHIESMICLIYDTILAHFS